MKKRVREGTAKPAPAGGQGAMCGREVEPAAPPTPRSSTSGEDEGQLVPKSAARLNADAARAAALEPVAAAVKMTCSWAEFGRDWEVGDYRFLVLEFWPKKGVCLYVQLWSEPGEAVLVEACSGAWNPTARPYVGPRQRAALRALGYRVGGRARNYRKWWTLSATADSRALAGDLVTVLVDAFGYRGQCELRFKRCADSRTAVARVFPAMERDDVKQMLRVGGYGIVSAQPVGPTRPGILKRLIHVDRPFPFTIELKGESDQKPGTFEAMRFITLLEQGRRVNADGLAVLQRECPFARICRDDEGDLIAIYDVPVAGASMRWFLLVLAVWSHAWNTANRVVQGLLGAGAQPCHPAGVIQDDAGDDADAELEEDDDGNGAGNRALRRQARTARTVVH